MAQCLDAATYKKAIDHYYDVLREEHNLFENPTYFKIWINDVPLDLPSPNVVTK